jgi:MOSC domain
MEHLSTAALRAGLGHVHESPPDLGRLELIVRRPAVGQREVLSEGTLETDVGLVGDTWNCRPSTRTPDRSPHPEMQLNIMNARVTALIAGTAQRWALAGDQLYVDMDISEANLPPGTRLRLGAAVIEVTAQPHLGCAKFTARFGRDAMRFVNTAEGRALRLRGMNAKVVSGGTIRHGDLLGKLTIPSH